MFLYAGAYKNTTSKQHRSSFKKELCHHLKMPLDSSLHTNFTIKMTIFRKLGPQKFQGI